MEKVFFTAWFVFNMLIYALLLAICIFVYVRLREKKLLFISLSVVLILLYICINFKTKNTHHSLSAGKRDPPVNKVLTRQFIQVENLGAGNLSMLLSYNTDSILYKKSLLDGLSLGHLWLQKSINTHIENNKVFYTIQGDMQWRLLGYLVYSQPKYFAENTTLSNAKPE